MTTLPIKVAMPVSALYTPKSPRPLSISLVTTTWPCASTRLIFESAPTAPVFAGPGAAAGVTGGISRPDPDPASGTDRAPDAPGFAGAGLAGPVLPRPGLAGPVLPWPGV